MKFLKASIDGFGKWTNTTFHFSDRSFYCFYGENESGKSTLQQFILYMMFGLPPKKRKKFIPKKQGSIAGTLTVYDETLGEITVQRIDGNFSCFLENGDKRSETWWQEQLNRISKEVYTAVNAFSATDLEAIQSMDHAAISDILFSIGLSGSTAIYNVEKQIADQLDSLYKRRGKNPLLNKQIEKIVQTARELERHRSEEAAYATYISEKETAENYIREEKSELQDVKQELLILDKWLHVLPQIHKYQQHQKSIALLPSTLTFPSEGETRYQQLKEKLLPKLSEYNLLKEKHSEYIAKLNTLRSDLLSDDMLERAESLLQEKLNYEHHLKLIEQQKAALQQEKKKCDEMLRLLEWDKDETKEIILPFYLSSTWEQLVKDYNSLHLEQKTLEEEQHLLKEKRINLMRDEKEVRHKRCSEEERKHAEERLAADQSGRENKQQIKNYEVWKKRQQSRSKKFAYIYITIIVLSVILGFVLDVPILYGAAFIAFVGGGIQYFYAGTQRKAIEDMLFSSKENDMLSPKERSEIEQLIEEERTLTHQLSDIDNAMRQNNLLEIQAEEQQQILEKRFVQLDDRIESERFMYPFLQGVEVIYWPELLKHIQKLQQLNKEVNDIEKDIAAKEAYHTEIDANFETFPYANSFKQLEAVLEKQKDTRVQINQYEQALDTTETDMTELNKLLELLKQEQRALFQAAGVNGENEFYKTAENHNKKEAMLQEMNSIKEQLQNLFSESKTEELLASTMNSVQLENRKEQVEQSIKEMEEAISNTHHQLGELQAQVERLEKAEDTSQLNFTYELDRNKLNEQAKEWAVLKLVQSALAYAKKTYQKKHFSKVMDLTGEYFAHMTSNRYNKVIPPEENGLFEVEDIDNIRYTVEELSQGTIDQLYISLRFAIAKAMRDQFDLPLLIDDAFVHFDQKRTTQSLYLLEQLSKEQQVIFFTCKKEIADQFKWVYPMEAVNI